MRTSALFGAKNFVLFEINGVSAWTRGVNFLRFCADVLYGRPLTKKSKTSLWGRVVNARDQRWSRVFNVRLWVLSKKSSTTRVRVLHYSNVLEYEYFITEIIVEIGLRKRLFHQENIILRREKEHCAIFIHANFMWGLRLGLGLSWGVRIRVGVRFR